MARICKASLRTAAAPRLAYSISQQKGTMVGNLRLLDDLEGPDLDIGSHQHVVGVAAFFRVMRGSRVRVAAEGYKVAEAELSKCLEHHAFGENASRHRRPAARLRAICGG